MAGYVGGGGSNPMQRFDCPFCGQPGVAGARCAACHRSSRDPFVAVFDVGQGNCNALVDGGGRVIAYFDYGYSTAGTRQPSPPFRPCFCDKPLIILSHWDLDHINLAKHPHGKQGLTMNWLVPEQDHSTHAGKVQQWIKQAGGRLHVWPQSASPHRHMVFPWGFVERCTEPPAQGINGSGLAALVCVQNSRSNPIPFARPDAPAADRAQAAADSASTLRARQAANTVGASVNALIAAPHRAEVAKLAKPLAIVLAASQTIAGRQPQMPAAECVNAAVRAAEDVRLGHNAVQIRLRLSAFPNPALPTLRGHNPGWATTVLTELATAAVAIHNPAFSFNKRVRIASTHLSHDNSIDDQAWSWLGIGAAAPPAHPVTNVKNGLAPVHSGERFVLLNGDADFRWVPSMNRRHKPMIAALTAMHHGAVFEDGYALHRDAIPFAPGSRAAKAVVRFRFHPPAAIPSVVSVVSEAGRALSKKRHKGRRRVLRLAASRAARAAAAAVHAVQIAHPNEVTAAPRKFAAAAAAAAVAAWKYPNARIVGLATMLGSTTERVAGDTGCSAIESVVEVAAQAVLAQSALPAVPLTPDQVAAISAGAMDGELVGMVPDLAQDTVAVVGNDLLTPDNAGQEAASALAYLYHNYTKLGLSSKKAKEFKNRIALDVSDEDVLNDLATAATACILASRHSRRHNRIHTLRQCTDASGNSLNLTAAQLGALYGSVVATTAASYSAAPAGVNGIALEAACLAAERAVGYVLGTTAEAVRTVARAGTTPRLRSDAYHAVGSRSQRDPRGGRIAYSYGVDSGNFGHEYSSVVAGGLGHPHPLALMAYEAHGWTRRRNASRRARHAGLQGETNKANPCGPASLSWNSVAGTPHAIGRFRWRCASCGREMALQD